MPNRVDPAQYNFCVQVPFFVIKHRGIKKVHSEHLPASPSLILRKRGLCTELVDHNNGIVSESWAANRAQPYATPNDCICFLAGYLPGSPL